MTGIIDWAAKHARMVLAFVVLSLLAGALSYAGLPKEGEPDIEIPAIFVSVPFPGISAEDAEKLLVKPMETELADLDGLKSMSGTAEEGYAGVALEFEFGWDKTKILADVRDSMNTAEGLFPEGAERKPCSSSQPCSRRNRAWASVSTPSAVTDRPSACAIEIVARAIAQLWSLVSIPRTKA